MMKVVVDVSTKKRGNGDEKVAKMGRMKVAWEAQGRGRRRWCQGRQLMAMVEMGMAGRRFERQQQW